MTTGTVAPYLELPEDINPPRPGYFHDVFHLVHAYIELLRNVPPGAAPAKGLIRLYGLRSGVLDFDSSVLETSYLSLLRNDRVQQQRLKEFALSSIAYNIQALYQLITNTLSKDLTKSFGDDKCLSAETVHALNHFAKLQGQILNSPRVQRDDGMDALVQTCHFNAIYRHNGVSSSEAIIRAIGALDLIVHGNQRPVSAQPNERLLNALKIVFYIGCRYYHLNLLRFSDEIINRSYDRVLNITDLTLAAIPFDPTLIYNCPDDTSFITRWGIEYVQSLEAVLLFSGGVRYEAAIAIDANGNKGLTNV